MAMLSPREQARRQHEALALICLLQCWKRGIEGIVIDREELTELLELDRLRNARIQSINPMSSPGLFATTRCGHTRLLRDRIDWKQKFLRDDYARSFPERRQASNWLL